MSLIFEIGALPLAQHGHFSIQNVTHPFMLTENLLAIMSSLEMRYLLNPWKNNLELCKKVQFFTLKHGFESFDVKESTV